MVHGEEKREPKIQVIGCEEHGGSVRIVHCVHECSPEKYFDQFIEKRLWFLLYVDTSSVHWLL